MNEQGIFELCKGAPNARLADCCDQCRYDQNIGILMGVGTCENMVGVFWK